MKKIYIVLTYSGSLLSKAIRVVKQSEYTHVSLSLDKELNEMYSFGRLNAYNAFIGGFVQESPNYGTFKRFSKTITKILCFEVSEEQYQDLKEVIKKFNQNKKDYKFNFIGLCSVALRIRVTKENKFYCAEFIKYLLDECQIDTSLPELVTPSDFENIPNTIPVYTGYLKNYLN